MKLWEKKILLKIFRVDKGQGKCGKLVFYMRRHKLYTVSGWYVSCQAHVTTCHKVQVVATGASWKHGNEVTMDGKRESISCPFLPLPFFSLMNISIQK